MSELSPQISIKLSPIIKSTISRQFGADIEDMLAEVLLPEMSVRDKSNLYSKMLENFLGDTTSISFAVTNRKMMGNLLPADLWFLTFFSMVTTRRCRGDNLLMLGLVGKDVYLILFIYSFNFFILLVVVQNTQRDDATMYILIINVYLFFR